MRNRIAGLAPGSTVRLLVDGRSIRFRQMENGWDGRPTPALKADPNHPESRAIWAELQSRRGQSVALALDDGANSDPYLAYLHELFWEWNTPGDAEAFDDL